MNQEKKKRIIMAFVGVCLCGLSVGLFKMSAFGTDAICVIIGFLLKATVGIGTLITAFLMGPLIEFFNKWFSRPLLYKNNQPNI